MMEARNGFSTETRFLNGNGKRARCFGFTVNVCNSPFSFPAFLMETWFYSGVRKDRSFVRTVHSYPFG
jgi:hypothetical protein